MTLRVLVIDDEPAIRLLCRVNLERDGFVVDEAPDGGAGLALAAERPPDVIFLDVMLPGEDGFAVAVRLQAVPQLVDVPVVFLTARADVDSDDALRRVGAAGCITKPFNPAVLGETARRLAGRGSSDD